MEQNILIDCYRLINKYNRFAKMARRYGTEHLLYPSEIHMIEAIGTAGEVTTTKLAEILGITKGGVSQTTAKLANKGLIEKRSVDGSNEIIIMLTESGQTAYSGHRSFHEGMLAKVNAVMEGFSCEERAALSLLIETLESEVDKMGGLNNEV